MSINEQPAAKLIRTALTLPPTEWEPFGIVEVDPFANKVLLFMNFDETLLLDRNIVRSNTIHTSAEAPSLSVSPILNTTAPRYGSGCMEVLGGGDRNISATGDDFRESTTSALTIEFWFKPLSWGSVGSTAASVLRGAIMTLTRSYPVTSSNSIGYLWYSPNGGGRIYYANSGQYVSVTSGVWCHLALVIDPSLGPGNELQLYLDGVRAFNVSNPAQNFNTIYFGNMGYGNSLSDGSWTDYCTSGIYDDIRMTAAVRYSGPSFVPPGKLIRP